MDEFINNFAEKLTALKKHSFIAFQQNSYKNDLRNQLNSGEYLVLCDFSENYTFVVQNEVHGFHWNNNQATIHPFVIYYKEIHTIKTCHLWLYEKM